METVTDIRDEAEQALRTFGGYLTMRTASMLLRHWRRGDELTVDEFADVVARFARVDQ